MFESPSTESIRPTPTVIALDPLRDLMLALSSHLTFTEGHLSSTTLKHSPTQRASLFPRAARLRM